MPKRRLPREDYKRRIDDLTERFTKVYKTACKNKRNPELVLRGWYKRLQLDDQWLVDTFLHHLKIENNEKKDVCDDTVVSGSLSSHFQELEREGWFWQLDC